MNEELDKDIDIRMTCIEIQLAGLGNIFYERYGEYLPIDDILDSLQNEIDMIREVEDK